MGQRGDDVFAHFEEVAADGNGLQAVVGPEAAVGNESLAVDEIRDLFGPLGAEQHVALGKVLDLKRVVQRNLAVVAVGVLFRVPGLEHAAAPVFDAHEVAHRAVELQHLLLRKMLHCAVGRYHVRVGKVEHHRVLFAELIVEFARKLLRKDYFALHAP